MRKSRHYRRRGMIIMGENYIYDWDEINKTQNMDRVMEPALAYRCDEVGDKTLEDYLALPEGTRVELIDGVFYDMAAPNTMHQIISDEINYS